VDALQTGPGLLAVDRSGRGMARRELGSEDGLIVGRVRRFLSPKNHMRLLRTLSSALARKQTARLFLVSDGTLRPQIEHEIPSLGHEENVIPAGVREDTLRLVSAVDVLLFPSRYEGLPVTVVEAQASGLPCVVSDVVTNELALTDLVRFVSLDEPGETSADTVLKTATINGCRSWVD